MTGDPERYGYIGGSKVSDKLGVIANLLKRLTIFLGGGMALHLPGRTGLLIW